MSDRIPTHYDEEIDLFEVLETLWAGKHVVLGASLIALLASFGLSYTSTVAPTFEVTAPYSVQVAPMDAQNPELCQTEQCRRDMVASRAVMLSNGEWRSVNQGAAMALTTEAPKPVAEYQERLEELNQTLRDAFLKEAKAEADFIQTEISVNLQQTEVVASSLLVAKRVLVGLEREGVPLAFGPISINPVNHRKPLSSFVMAAFLGALAGSAFVLLRKAFRDRQIRNGAEH